MVHSSKIIFAITELQLITYPTLSSTFYIISIDSLQKHSFLQNSNLNLHSLRVHVIRICLTRYCSIQLIDLWVLSISQLNVKGLIRNAQNRCIVFPNHLNYQVHSFTSQQSRYVTIHVKRFLHPRYPTSLSYCS